MALKTFNIDAAVYGEFSKHCKEQGISMSKKVEKFIAGEIKSLKAGKGEKGMENKIGEERAERENELMDFHPLGKYC